jgi:hypothetical protein
MQPIHVINQSVPDAPHFGHGTVGATEQPLDSIDWPLRKFVTVQAAAGNSSTVTVGRSGDAANGWILQPGESTPPIPVDSTRSIAVVGGDAGQNYNWLGI